MSDRGQWGCIGAVLAAIIGGVFLIASVVISQERTRQAQTDALATIGVLETQISVRTFQAMAP